MTDALPAPPATPVRLDEESWQGVATAVVRLRDRLDELDYGSSARLPNALQPSAAPPSPRRTS